MKLYRARAWRTGPATFDPLESSGSIGGAGWRFNDIHTEILYTAEVEALAILEVAVRPGWETVRQVLIGTIELPDGLVVEPRDLGILLPSNWNARPVAPDSRSIAREFLHAAPASNITVIMLAMFTRHDALASAPRRWRFALTGSSARRLRRGNANLLAGRVISRLYAFLDELSADGYYRHRYDQPHNELAWTTIEQLTTAVTGFLNPVLAGREGTWHPIKWVWDLSQCSRD